MRSLKRELAPWLLLAALGGIATGLARPERAWGGIQFSDQAEAAGVSVYNTFGGHSKRYILEAHGSGAAFLDFDGDGRLDLYVVNGSTFEAFEQGPGNSLFRNRGNGTFEARGDSAGVSHRGWGSGVAVGDVDNDGDPDLYVTNFGANVLYENTGDSRFRDVTASAGVAGESYSASAAFFDSDGDGDLDLYVTNYVRFDLSEVPEDPACDERCMYLGGIRVYCGPEGMVGARDRLYRNDGQGRFRDITTEADVDEANDFYGLGVVPEDFDNDGWIDLFVANDETPNVLFRNRGDGLFHDIATAAGVAFNADGDMEAGMGVDVADYDNDGDMDIYVSNFYGETNTLYRNDGDWRFTDVTTDVGLATATIPMLGWGTHFLDADLDGDLDLFVANGHVYPQVDLTETGTFYAQPNQLFRNVGGGQFAGVADAGPGLEVVKVSRGSCVGDYDGDGDPDLFVVNLNDTPTLLRNDTQGAGNWIGVRLQGVNTTRDGSGARVRVRTGGGDQVRSAGRTGGYLGANDPVVLFGIGADSGAQVTVIWLDGQVSELGWVEANQVLRVTENEGRAE